MSTINELPADERAVEPMLGTAADVAKLLDLSERTVWRLLSAKRLPEPLRIGGSVRWRLDQVRQWISAGCPAQNGGKQ